jgi:hypothetical protein
VEWRVFPWPKCLLIDISAFNSIIFPIIPHLKLQAPAALHFSSYLCSVLNPAV